MKASALLALLLLPSFAAAKPGATEFLSPVYTIDRIWKSMLGPHTLKRVTLGKEGQKPELLWITGFKTDIVGADGKTPQNKQFMCHINLDVDGAKHAALMGLKRPFGERLFTLSQGMFAIKFPEGYGVPVSSDEMFTLYTQVLNHNQKTGTFEVRHKVTIEYKRDAELKTPMKALVPVSGFVMALISGKDGFFSQEKPAPGTEHASCQPGTHAPGAPMGTYNDPYGRQLTGHWVVKPGRETKHTLVTKILNLPYDTTMRYAASHLHPFAVSLELVDLTTNKPVFKTVTRAPKTGIGLDDVSYYSSTAGVPLYKDHEYELVSVYDNTTSVDQDSMASMFLYVDDKDFVKPKL